MYFMSKRKKNNIIIGSLLAVVLLMAVGYAAFSSVLNISGTGSITSSWNIRITNITSSLHGGATNAVEPTYDNENGLTASFSTNLVSPGDYAEYTIEVSNLGSIDATLTGISISDPNNSAIVFETSGISQGDNLLKDTKDELIVKVSYNEIVTSDPENKTSNITVTLTYEQATGTTPPSGNTANMGGQDVEIVNSGDGLYEDSYEEGRLIYRGQNPNNYIEFNGELWRIVAKETDGTYKIIRNELLPQNDGYTEMAFDEANHRATGNNTYCTYPSDGCGVFGAVDGTFQTPDGQYSGTVTEDSSIAEYLNNDYYANTLNATAKNQMTSHSFNIGAVQIVDVNENDSMAKNIADEQLYKWNGNVGLINVTDILRASTNPLCTSVNALTKAVMDGNYKPCDSNYLLDYGSSEGIVYWTINAMSNATVDLSSQVYTGFADSLSAIVDGSVADDEIAHRGVRPVIFLKSDITLSGEGTNSNPFQIN